MGANQSIENNEKPSKGTVATLYYFGGRGLADQVRWLLAATEVSFTQRVIDTRKKFLKMASLQLPFGQLPLLQIDNLEIVQSQAIVRYLAKRANLQGTTMEDEIKCDMIAETIKDLLPFVTILPFQRLKSEDVLLTHIKSAKEKWMMIASRLEIILERNGGKYLVGSTMTYVDILVAHILTWFVEECGNESVDKMPLLVRLQNGIISLPGIQAFIRSQAYYPIGDRAYCEQVNSVLARNI